MVLYFKYFYFYLFALVIVSCGRDDDALVQSISPPNPEMPEIEVEQLTSLELAYVENLLRVEVDINELWPLFNDFRAAPIYIITGEDQGIYFNPPTSQIQLSKPISYNVDVLNKVPLYRNSLLHQFAISEILPWQSYLFSEYDGVPLLLFDITRDLTVVDFYTAYKNRYGYYNVSVLFHELFHTYSVFGEASQQFLGEDNWVYDINNYPLTETTLPYLLMLYDVMIDAHLVTTVEEKNTLLRYYVAIQQELDEIDPTPNNLVRHHGFYFEKVEGPARYIEVFGTLESLNNNTLEDPSHGFSDYALQISTRADLRQVYAFRMFYHTGSGVIHLLNTLGYENLDQSFLVPTNTPFDIARDFLNLSETEIDLSLEAVKNNYGWEDYIERSQYLLSL